ncbi:dnaJ homolog subfamily C member 1-like [Ptychodera flava]|uniref:dnaJ homolog subfamily C member 1-like n=1 Tax=Ptychodera flava TaxID=63121 RepID=UPI003969C1BB
MTGLGISGSLFVLYLTGCVTAWDSEELELFDLVEEIQQNFYEVLGLDSSASQGDIKRAYRKLSLQLHPDKNKEEDAEEKFRQLVAVAEVLKDEGKRKRYDEILVHGLPDWKQPVFYYRRVRKMGLMELGSFLVVIIIIGQYLVAWSVYLEKKLVLEEVLSKKKKYKKKKKDSKQNKNTEGECQDEYMEELNSIPKPQITNLLPFQVYRLIKSSIKAAPESVSALKSFIESSMKKNQDDDGHEDDEDEHKRIKRVHKDQFEKVEYKMSESTSPVVSYTTTANDTTEHDKVKDNASATQKSCEWTDDDISMLARSMAKYPGGTAARWEKIAEDVGRTVQEVTKKAKEIKSAYAISVQAAAQGITGGIAEKVISKSGKIIQENEISTRVEDVIAVNSCESDVIFRDSKNTEEETGVRRRQKRNPKTSERTLLIGQKSENISANSIEVADLKNKTKIEEENSDEMKRTDKTWSQEQQKMLELSLKKYPKTTPERWDKITAEIPGKTKDECIVRYKELVEMVRKKKMCQD